MLGVLDPEVLQYSTPEKRKHKEEKIHFQCRPVFIEKKNSGVSGPAQLRATLFQGRWYLLYDTRQRVGEGFRDGARNLQGVFWFYRS